MVAEAITRRDAGVPSCPEDIFMTDGASPAVRGGSGGRAGRDGGAGGVWREGCGVAWREGCVCVGRGGAVEWSELWIMVMVMVMTA